MMKPPSGTFVFCPSSVTNIVSTMYSSRFCVSRRDAENRRGRGKSLEEEKRMFLVGWFCQDGLIPIVGMYIFAIYSLHERLYTLAAPRGARSSRSSLKTSSQQSALSNQPKQPQTYDPLPTEQLAEGCKGKKDHQNDADSTGKNDRKRASTVRSTARSNCTFTFVFNKTPMGGGCLAEGT
jgi:hypothetical protein